MWLANDYNLMNFLKRIACITLLLTGCLSTVSFAETGQATAMIGITSDYVERGLSQSGDGSAPAVSGGIDYRNALNWYAGLFVSSSEFTNQVDAYLGHVFSFGTKQQHFLDLGAIGTYYPQQNDDDGSISEDTYEVYLGGGTRIGNTSWDLYLSYDPEFSTLYPEMNLRWPIKMGSLAAVDITAHIGALVILDEEDAISANTPDDYTDYSIGLAKNGWALLVSDTDLKDDEPRFIVRKRWDWAL